MALPEENAPSGVSGVAPDPAPSTADWDFGGGGVNFGDAVNKTLANMAMGRAAQRSKEERKKEKRIEKVENFELKGKMRKETTK